MNDNRFTKAGGAYYWARSSAGYGVRTSINQTTNPITITSKGNGDYEAKIFGLGPNFRSFDAGTTFLLTVNTGNANEAATVVSHRGGPDRFVVNDDSCFACHGNQVFRAPEGPESAEHHGTSPRGVQACVVCHNRDNFGPGIGVGTATDGGVGLGSRLMGYVHGIHNSKNMPGGPVQIVSGNALRTVTAPPGTYVRSIIDGGSGTFVPSTSEGGTFSVGFPSYMNNCSVCHNTAESLAAVNEAPPTFTLCMSCHQSWDAFPTIPLASTHRGITLANATATSCQTAGCHVPGAATTIPNTAADFHNGARTERAGVIYNGDDLSVELGKTVRMAITGVTLVAGPPAQQQISWTAEQRQTDGGWAPVSPCNSSFAAGPVFYGATADGGSGASASNLSILRAYAQGNDWVNEGIGTSPGQPGSAPNVTSTNTNCTANPNVAVTTVNAETTAATLAIVSVQGKPQVRFAAGAGTNYEIVQIRSESPVYEFNPSTGAEATVKRRNVADIDKCLACHEGSMYQHGGNRIDSIDLCEMCHNPAANEKNNRVTMGVDATEAYDGLVGESYDLKYMVHAIHSAGETGKPLAYYRSNGIYFFGTKEALADVTTWPGSGCQAVAGSTAKLGTDCSPAPGTGPGAYKNHNFVEIHYPRSLADCGACHTDGALTQLPDQRQAVALTIDPGAAPWGNTGDDVLIGPNASSCMSCHQSGDSLTQFNLRQHAYGFGFQPGAGTRAQILDVPTNANLVERCAGCHQNVVDKHAIQGVQTVSDITGP